jgi:hypothetical protein
MAASKRKEVVMRSKINSLVLMVLALALITAVVPTLALADEFKFDGPPAFTVNYPKGSKPEPNIDPENVWSIKTPGGVIVRARVAPIPEGLELKDAAEKWFLPGLIKLVKTSVRMIDNKEITLSDGTKAYYSEITWDYRGQTGWDSLKIITMLVSVFRDGKLVAISAGPWDNFGASMEIVKSLKFQ